VVRSGLVHVGGLALALVFAAAPSVVGLGCDTGPSGSGGGPPMVSDPPPAPPGTPSSDDDVGYARKPRQKKAKSSRAR
jgi:hypothetical protein